MWSSLSLPSLSAPKLRSANYSRCLVVAMIMMAFALRLYRLDHQSLWEDEVYTVLRGNMSLLNMLRSILRPFNHAPLYFTMMHYWQRLVGDSEFAVRFFSLGWGVLSVAAIFRLGAAIGGGATGLISALLLAISPFHIWYSQEARMYALVTFFTLGANYFFVKILRGDDLRGWFGYAICTLLAIYTHYFAWLIPLSHFLFLFWHRRALKSVLLKWLIWIAALVFVYLPWIAIVVLAGAQGAYGPNIGWIAPIRWIDPFLTLYVFGLGATADLQFPLNYLSALTLLAMLSLPVLQIFTDNESKLERELLVHWLFTPLLLVSMISWGLSIQQHFSIYMDRYLIVISPAFLILVASGLSSIAQSRKKLATVASILILTSIAFSLYNLYLSPEYHREDWREVSRYLEEQALSSDVLIVDPDVHFILTYYFPGKIHRKIVPFFSLANNHRSYLLREASALTIQGGIKPTRLWLVSFFSNSADTHGFAYQRNAYIAEGCPFDRIKAWFDAHYPILQERTFNGICLTLYDNEFRSDE